MEKPGAGLGNATKIVLVGALREIDKNVDSH
jgi:hypothetical protein